MYRISVVLLLKLNWMVVVLGKENVDLRPRQTFTIDSTMAHRFTGRSSTSNSIIDGDNSDHFKLLQLDGQSLLVGARDSVYNLSLTTLQVHHILEWTAPAQTIEECLMKGKSKHECHNYIRVMVRQANGRSLICGTHAFAPKCREYALAIDEGGSLRDRRQFDGQAISPYDPRDNSSAIYIAETNELYTATVSDFAGNDPLIYRKKLTDGGVDLRTQRDDLRVLDEIKSISGPNFVSSFADGDHVYFWYRELAAEASDSDGKQVYARVARVCKGDRGGARFGERWTSFAKARLNCSLPGAAQSAFYFNELQSVSNPTPTADGSSIVFAVFSTPAGALRMSAVCAFRMDAVRRVFDSGDFKVQRSSAHLWTPVRSYDLPTPRPGSCVADSRRLSETIVSFIVKNPLLNEAVPSTRHQPLLVEGIDRAALTQIAVNPEQMSVSGLLYDTIFVGTIDGRVLKLVETGGGQTSIVQSVRVFEKERQPVVSMLVAGNNLIVVSADEVASVPLQNCDHQRTCSGCVALQDPNCAWDQDQSLCVTNIDNGRRWKEGSSLVQNIQLGRSEQCPEGVIDLFSIDEGQTDRITIDQKALYSGHSLALAVFFTLITALALGFAAGYRTSRWRIASQHHSNASTSSSDYESCGRRPLTRHDSLGANKLDHVYGTTPNNKSDAVSLVLTMPATSVSNGGSGLATPRVAEKNVLTAFNGTLPRDYKAKKVFI